MGIQTILFDRTRFTVPQAIKWLEKHKRVHYKVDIRPNVLRFRQYDPIRGKRYFSKPVDAGVTYVIDY